MPSSDSACRERVGIEHHAYELNPGFGASRPLRDWLQERFGDQYEAVTARVQAVASQVGLHLDFERAVAADTRLAHRLVRAAHPSRKADAMLARLMKAHFEEALDIAHPQTLQRLAADVGVDPRLVERVLQGEQEDAVEADVEAAPALGIRGVPFFVIDGRWALSGAQPVEVFEQALRAAVSPTETPRPA